MHHRFSLPAAAALLAMLACSDAPDPVSVPSVELPLVVAAAPASEGWQPFEFMVYTCDEDVYVTGRFHPLYHEVETSSGIFVYVGNLNAKGIGIGQTSGARYQWNDVLPFTVKASDDGSATTDHEFAHTHLIGQGGAINYVFNGYFTIVFSADGTMRVLIDDYRETCG